MTEILEAAENTVWYLKRSRLFDRISDEVVEGCSHLFVRTQYPRRTVLFEQGDAARVVYLVKSGKVRISRTSEDGKELTIAVLGAGDLFGEEVVFGREVERTTQATCLESSLICTARMQDVFGIMSSNPLVALNIAKYLSEQLDDAHDTMEDMASRKVDDRLMRMFARLAEDHGESDPRGTRIAVRLTHGQIASLIGSTRETVSLELANLVRAGRVLMDGSTYILP